MFHLFDITAKRAQLTPGRIAMKEVISGRSVTYRELDDCAARAASLLAREGLAPGDKVAVLCRNRIEFFELLFACGKLGAILVPLNWRMPAIELQAMVDDCAPDILFYGQEDAETAHALIPAGVPAYDFDEKGPGGYRLSCKSLPRYPGRLVWPGDDIWYLLYTSGTTGTPKAVMQTYAMAMVNYINIGQAVDLRSTDTTLNFLPLFHTGGINLHTLPALIAGARALILPGFDADRMIDLLEHGELTIFFGVPAVYQQLGLHPRFNKVDLSNVRSWASGGAALPTALIEQYAERGALICSGFGMTETGPTAFLMNPEAVLAKNGSVGIPQILSSVRIVDTDGEDVAQGETGELWMAGPGITPGYWHRPQATKDTFAQGGWLKSGDLARQDGDGYYYIVGRLKDMFISGGENVYTIEVEQILARHPAILDAAVLGVPDARWGEVGCAYLQARPGMEIPDTHDLAAFCRERLAAYKVPKIYVTVDDFPRTAAGKIQKHLIVDERVKT